MNFSFPFYNPYYPYSYNRYYHNNYTQNNFSKKNEDNIANAHKSSYDNINENEKKRSSFLETSHSEDFIEIFGLKLHFDDILLICLIFFLYKEEVHDTYLFISLILLLLS